MNNPTPWTRTMRLRPEIIRSGHVDDVQVSLADAVWGTGGDVSQQSVYADPKYYADITHPSGRLVDLMAQVKVRLMGTGAAVSQAPAVWRLDQAMGGGKSHGLIGLWHLAEHTQELAATELGRAVDGQAAGIAGADAFTTSLGKPVCVVMDCDNPAPSRSKDGPASTLGERFLFRLFDGAHRKWMQHKDEIVNKAKIAEVISGMGVPVLILIDEVMDYLRWADSQQTPGLLPADMAFLRSLLDAVNDIDNCVLVMVMIASERDTMAVGPSLSDHRDELESLLVRNGTTTTVTSGGDFGAILRKRLFVADPPAEVVDSTGAWIAQHLSAGDWDGDAASAGMDTAELQARLGESYPFHPSLIALAQDHWSQHAGFQKVRSTIQVFAGVVHALNQRAQSGDWVPALIGSGDLVLDDATVREALLSSGLVSERQIQSSLREICTGDVCDPDNPLRGTARRQDLERDAGSPAPAWAEANPKASERIATALFIHTISPRPQGARGATESELLLASFEPATGYNRGDAEAVWLSLQDPNSGLAALDSKEGSGRRPKRYWLETKATLRMLHRREHEAVSDDDRDRAVTETAIELASAEPFSRPVRKVVSERRELPSSERRELPSEADLREMISEAGLDDGRTCRLVILDSRWFSLLNGIDQPTRKAVQAAFGISEQEPDKLMPLPPLHMTWAASCVFVVINTQQRSRARNLARNFIAWDRVAKIDVVTKDPETHKKAREELREAKERFERKVKDAYQHVLYLAEDTNHQRVMHTVTLSSQTQTALNGAAVWDALAEAGKAVPSLAPNSGLAEPLFDATALLHNLREADWGRPLAEIRDEFWKAPRLPLLPGGPNDLLNAIHKAVTQGHMQIVDATGNERRVSGPNDINLSSNDLRIARPAPVQPEPKPEPTPVPYAPSPVPSPLPVTPQAPPARIRMTLTRRFDAAGSRQDAYEVLSALADTVDEHAEYINFNIELIAPQDKLDRLTNALEGTDIRHTITDSSHPA